MHNAQATTGNCRIVLFLCIIVVKVSSKAGYTLQTLHACVALAKRLLHWNVSKECVHLLQSTLTGNWEHPDKTDRTDWIFKKEKQHSCTAGSHWFWKKQCCIQGTALKNFCQASEMKLLIFSKLFTKAFKKDQTFYVHFVHTRALLLADFWRWPRRGAIKWFSWCHQEDITLLLNPGQLHFISIVQWRRY